MPSKSQKLLQNVVKKQRASKKDGDKEFTTSNVKMMRERNGMSKYELLDLDRIMLKATALEQLHIPHYLFPGFNACQLPVDDLSELQDFPNITVSVPHPVYVAPKNCDRVDMCHRRTITRATYLKRLSYARTSYMNAIKKNRKLRADENVDIYHSSLFDLVERVNSHPDPYFKCSYDYYYTGGNLCVLPSSGYVAHTGGEGLKDLHISRFASKHGISKFPLRAVCQKEVGRTSEILQVVPFCSQWDDRPNCLATRERNTITLHYLDAEEGTLKGLTQFNSESTPFIGFAQSADDLSKFVVTNMKQHVRLFDVQASAATLSKVFVAHPEEQWNTVMSWREHTYLYANSKELYLMDVRTPPSEWQSNKCSFGDNEFFCQTLVSLARSNFKKQFYVGSSHRLYCLDTRCWGSTFEGRGTVCRWIHQMEYPPIMMSTYREDDAEYIALSSPLANDFRICELTRGGRVADDPAKKAEMDQLQCSQKYVYKSLSLPYKSTTLKEAYEAARRKGKCLRPEANLKNRLACCTTGLSFYTNPRNPHGQRLLLMSNSNGDVFAQKIGVRESQAHLPRTSALTDDVMCQFEETICNMIQPPLNCTDVKDMKVMKKVFLSSKLSASPANPEAGDDGDEFDFKRNIRPKPRWQKSMQELHSYKDVLAKSLLSLWDIDYTEEKSINLTHLDNSVKIDPEARVSSWLNSNVSETPTTGTPKDAMNNSATALKFDTTWTKFDDDESLRELSRSLVEHSTKLLYESTDLAQLETSMYSQPEHNSTLNMSAESTTQLTASQTKSKETKTKKRKAYVKGF